MINCIDLVAHTKRIVLLILWISLFTPLAAQVDHGEHVSDGLEAKDQAILLETLVGKAENVGLKTEMKEKEIQALNREKEIIDLKLNRSRLINYMLASIAISGLLVAYLLFRNYRQRQRVKSIELRRQSDRKILDMERRILASVIETENRERKRFAADLHDGLGPLLSSAKLYLGEILDTEGIEQIQMVDQATEILDHAIQNIREISRNIVPETLTEKGLKRSLEEFCARIERIGHLEISIDVLDMDKDDRLNPGLEVVLFRILTELINNTVRHASANKIELSVESKNSHIEVFYADDGVGFEVKQVLEEPGPGMGLQNIISRIKSLHGSIDIDSRARQGMTIRIKIPV